MRHLLAALSLPFAITAFGFDIVKDAAPMAEIVTQEPIARHTTFFAQAVKRCTGADLPVVNAPSGGKNAIVFKIEARTPFTEDAYDITFPNVKTMQITGSYYSIRWALNRLLEDQGVCFCQAGDHGTHFPKLTSFTIEAKPVHGDYDVKLFRDLYQDGRENALRIGGKHAVDIEPEIFFHHNLYHLLPPSKYGKAPFVDKIMPLLNGKRFYPPRENSCWQPCFGNHETLEETVKSIRAYLDKNPTFRLVSLGINDSGGFCQCEKCLEMNGGIKKGVFYPNNSFSDVYYKWCAMVIDEVLKTHPDTYFGCIAYAEVFDPPSFKIHPRLTPVFCIETYQYSFPAGREKYEKLFKAWESATDSLGVYDYGYGCLSYCFPRIYTKMQDKVMKDFIKRGCRSYFAEGDGNFGEGPKRYLSYKLCQNGNLDLDTELDKWYTACVGKEAAPYLKKYYDTLEKFWTSPEVQKTAWFRSLCIIYMSFYEHSHIYGMTMDVMNECKEAMEKMIELAEQHGDEDQKIRARDQMSYFHFYEALAHTSACGLFPPDRKFTSPEQAKEFIRAIPDMSEYFPLLEKYGNEIYELRKRENFETALNSITVFTMPSERVPFSLQLGYVMPFIMKYPDVMDELKKVAASPIHKFYKDRIEYIIDQSKAIEYVDNSLSVEDELKAWGNNQNVSVEVLANGKKRIVVTAPSAGTVSVKRLVTARPHRQFLLSYKLTFKNASPRHACLGQYLSASRPTLGISQFRWMTATSYADANTHDCYDTNISSDNGYAGYALFDFSGMAKGEVVYIDELSIKETEVVPPVEEIKAPRDFADYPAQWGNTPGAVFEGGKMTLPSFKVLNYKLPITIPEGTRFLRIMTRASGKGRFQFRFALRDAEGKILPKVLGDKIECTEQPQEHEFELFFTGKRKPARKVYVEICSLSETPITLDEFQMHIAK